MKSRSLRTLTAGLLLLGLAALPGVGQQASAPAVGDVVAGLYTLVSASGGTMPDWEKVRALFLKEAVIVLRTSRTALTAFDLEGFIKDFVDFYERPFKRGETTVVPRDSGFTEKVVRVKVWEFGDMAHVLVLYEAMITGFPMAPQQGVDGRHRLRLHRGLHDLRPDRHQGLGLPGRRREGQDDLPDG